jgi:hypothetical protein
MLPFVTNQTASRFTGWDEAVATMSDKIQRNAGSGASARTWHGVLPSFFVCATIAFIAYLVASSQSESSRRLWVPVVVETNGNQTILGETRQMEFWTPSARTKDYLTKSGGEISDKEKWEIIPSDDAVIQFGGVLRSNLNVVGYRRFEVWGQGRTGFKPGWWWIMNVSTNYTARDLAQDYHSFWKSPQTLFVEVVDNRGSHEK